MSDQGREVGTPAGRAKNGCCRACGRIPEPKMGPQILWGNGNEANWNLGQFGPGVHSIHYERGPTPCVLVRPKRGDDDLVRVAQRGAGVEGVPLWAGETLDELDCRSQYQVKGPEDLYGPPTTELDVFVDDAGGGAPYSLVLDVDSRSRRPGLVELHAVHTMVAEETAEALLWIPTRGVVLAELLFQIAVNPSFDSASVALTIQADVEGAWSSIAAAVLSPMTTAGDRRAVILGEYDRTPANVLGITPALVGGMPDRIGVLHTGTIAGENAGVAIRLSYRARLHEAR